MLPPFIIDQIRKREEDDRREERRERLPIPAPIRHEQKPSEDDGDRGVVIIDLGADS